MSISGDSRIETVVAEYKHGLSEIEKLRPVIYTHKGNDVPLPVSFDATDALKQEGRQQDAEAIYEATRSMMQNLQRRGGKPTYSEQVAIQRAACCAPNRTSPLPYWDSDNFLFASLKKRWVGLIAQECETAMPELIEHFEATIDRNRVSDLRNVDPQPIIYALVNAVKELSARVKELEAKK